MSGLSEMTLTKAICLVRNRWDSQLSRSADIPGQQLFRLAGAVHSRQFDDRELQTLSERSHYYSKVKQSFVLYTDEMVSRYIRS